jgi:dihydroorotase
MVSDEDYKTKGNLIKWNPAIKSVDDRKSVMGSIAR